MSYIFNKDFAGQGVTASLAEPFDGEKSIKLEFADEKFLKYYYEEICKGNTKFVIKSGKVESVLNANNEGNESEKPKRKYRKKV